MANKKILIVSGEPSGDLHASNLVKDLKSLNPALQFYGIGGELSKRAGVDIIFDITKLALVGLVDVIKHISVVKKAHDAVIAKLETDPPDMAILVDYPGFNLRLERALKKAGYKGLLIHYICPTVWAWGKKRIGIMERNLDLLLTIFPFEKECFKKSRLIVHYTGHPLVDKLQAYSYLQAEGAQNIIALFPGSRKAEIEKNLPLQLQIARRLQKKHPHLKIMVSCAEDRLKESIGYEKDWLQIGPLESYPLKERIKLAIATSGTVTLELALLGIPSIVTYAISRLDCFLAQKIFKINLPFYCIVNIIMKQEVYPEFFGPRFTEDRAYEAAMKLIENSLYCQEKCLEMKNLLESAKEKDAAAHILNLEVHWDIPK